MKSIHVFLSESYSDWEIAPLCGLGKSFYGAEIHFHSVTDGDSIVSAAGLHVINLEPYKEAADQVIVICGSSTLEKKEELLLTKIISKQVKKGQPVAGICAGTVALARAGVLQNVQHTSNHATYLQDIVATYVSSEAYLDVPYAVSDKNIITAPAPAPASFAVAVLIAAGLPEETAAQIKHLLSSEHSE